MKRLRVFLLIAMVMALLAGCGAKNEVELEIDGYSLTVYTDSRIISTAKDNYKYEIVNNDVFKTTVTIHYPNGATYSRTMANTADFSHNDIVTTEGDYDEFQYVPGKVLIRAAVKAISQKKVDKNDWAERVKFVVAGIIVIPFGLFCIYDPEGIWYLRHWWSVNGGDPTEIYLKMTRLTGILCVALGVISILVAIFA